MDWWQAALLGLIEGITEYLPVSSTGHLILGSSLLGLDGPELKPAVDAFNIVIQGGAILAVLGLYRARVAQMLRGLVGRDPAGRRLFLLLVVAFMPAAVFGLLLNERIEQLLFKPAPVLFALALGGVYMIILDRKLIRPMREADRIAEIRGDTGEDERDLTTMSFRAALIIGLLQTLAMWPGTSRSMMTITAGVIVGLRPRQAAEFSFLLGLPTLGAATLYTLAKDLAQSDPNMFDVLGPAPILIGLAVATVSAAFAVRWLVAFLTRHGLAAFGWYRIALTAVLAGSIMIGFVDIRPPPPDDLGNDIISNNDIPAAPTDLVP